MKNHKEALIIAALFVVLSALQLFQIPFSRITTLGIDSFETHVPIFGNHSATQEVQLNGSLERVGAILVNMRRANAVSDVTVRVLDARTGEQLRLVVIPASEIKDDVFVHARLDTPLRAGHKIAVEFSAEGATLENPVGVRFHTENVYENGERLRDHKVVKGDLALQLRERLGFWDFVAATASENSQKVHRIVIAFGIFVITALLTLQIGWKGRPVHIRRRVEISIIILVALLAVGARATWVGQLHGVSGGDPYNYLLITEKISNLENPFAAVKRLPGYPLMLLPAYLSPTIDDQLYMRIVSVLSAGATLVLLGLLARRLGLPWSVQFLAPLLLAFQKDFWIVSFRPEPYTLYTALLLATLVLFFYLEERWVQITFGLVLGLAAMTRQEGFVLAALVGLGVIIMYRRKLWLGGYVRAFLPAFLIVLPFFIHNASVSGNPLYTPYFEGERLQIVDSPQAFFSAAEATWGVIGSMWRVSWDQLQRVAFADPLFGLAVFATTVWWALSRSPLRKEKWGAFSLIGAAFAVAVLGVWGFSVNTLAFTEVMTIVTAGVLLGSIIPFVATTGWRGGFIILVLASQILIATWFHTFPKHYQQSYPLLILMVVAALFITPKSNVTIFRGLRIAQLAAVIIPISLVTLLLFAQHQVVIDEQNQETALDYVVYEAVQVARALPKPVGSDQRYLQSQLYFDDDAHYLPGEDASSRMLEDAWIEEHNIKTLVVTSVSESFVDPRPDWELVFSRKAEAKNEVLVESKVYSIP